MIKKIEKKWSVLCNPNITKIKMIIKNSKTLLYIEPLEEATSQPVIDFLTIKMFNAFREHTHIGSIGFNGSFAKNICTMGVHECICGKRSTSCDYLLKSGLATNSLCIHYLAVHRDKVPEEELKKVEQLDSSDVLTNKDELMKMI